MCRSIYSSISLALACLASGHAFVVPSLHVNRRSSSSSSSSAVISFVKKKGEGGKGFGKNVELPTPPASVKWNDTPSKTAPAAAESTSSSSSSSFLQSVKGGSTEKPKADDLSPEERAKQLLREKYGMKTLEEERLSEKEREQLEAQRKQFAELKKKAESEEDFDLFMVIPGPVIQAIYAVLQLGIGISGLVFIASGLAITAEAWSKSGGDPLPADVDAFIANAVEPNFTTTLLVLLGFSVSLGGLAAAQLGSKSAQYKE